MLPRFGMTRARDSWGKLDGTSIGGEIVVAYSQTHILDRGVAWADLGYCIWKSVGCVWIGLWRAALCVVTGVDR